MKTLFEDVSSIASIQTWEDIKDWVKDHEGFLTKLTDYPGVTKGVKKGEYGKLWKLKNHDVTVKITTDQTEAAIARELKGQNAKAFLKIYEVVDIDKLSKNGKKIPPTQVRIQEFCYPIKEFDKHESKLTFIMDLLIGDDYGYEKFLTKFDIEDFYEFIGDTGLIRGERIYKDRQLWEELVPTVEKTVELLRQAVKDLTSITGSMYDLDVHPGNIMQDKQGNWKFVDF